jgi:hypothetical protein
MVPFLNKDIQVTFEHNLLYSNIDKLLKPNVTSGRIELHSAHHNVLFHGVHQIRS